VTLLALVLALAVPPPVGPPPNAKFDYQIGGDYPLPAGVEVVSRDWFIGFAPITPPAASDTSATTATRRTTRRDGAVTPREAKARPHRYPRNR